MADKKVSWWIRSTLDNVELAITNSAGTTYYNGSAESLAALYPTVFFLEANPDGIHTDFCANIDDSVTTLTITCVDHTNNEVYLLASWDFVGGRPKERPHS